MSYSDKCVPDPDRLVLIEAMGFMWRLPFSRVEEDLARGVATLVEDSHAFMKETE